MTNSSANYSIAQFQSPDGISSAWPLPSTTTLQFKFTEIGAFTLPTNLKVSAAISVSETDSGMGLMQAYIDNVDIQKTANGLTLSVPLSASAKVYGVSSDGRKKAVIDFSNSVVGISNTLTTQADANNVLLVGNVVNYAINNLSNDFTNINSLRGKYKVSIVISDLPLRKADGSPLPAMTLTTPTALDNNGNISASKSVSGRGLTGYLSLTH